MVIAIDGPAGAGKSTVARQVAARLGFLYVDTGAMYRAVTLKALRLGINLGDEKALTELARRARLTLRRACSPEERTRVLLDGEDVTEAIRDPAVSACVSLVAKVPGVRESLTEQQRELAKRGGAVVEGRDIGTCVVPEAERKIFLTAALEERARRRWEELRRAGHEVSREQVLEELRQRDALDSARGVAPLLAAKDAVVIDSTHLSVEETVEAVLRACGDR